MIASANDVKTTFFVCTFAQEVNTFKVRLITESISWAYHVDKLSKPLEGTNPMIHHLSLFLSWFPYIVSSPTIVEFHGS
jgi:hypothetical protein